MNETSNISGRPEEFSCPLFRKQGRASEDPNLPIDDRRKVIQTIMKRQLTSVG